MLFKRGFVPAYAIQIIFVVFALTAIAAAGVHVAYAQESACKEIPRDAAIRQSTVLCPNTYFLDTPLTIEANNIYLDCQGSRIMPKAGRQVTHGIIIKGHSSVVKNCFVRGFPIGIEVIGEYSQAVENSVEKSDIGIRVQTNKASIFKNKLYDIRSVGIELYESSEVLIAENKVLQKDPEQETLGLLITNGSNNQVNVNVFDALKGLCVVDSDYNSIKHNSMLTEDFCIPDLNSTNADEVTVALDRVRQLLMTNKFVFNRLENGSIVLIVNSVPQECFPQGVRSVDDLPAQTREHCQEWLSDMQLYLEYVQAQESSPGKSVLHEISFKNPLIWMILALVIILCGLFIYIVKRQQG